MAQVKISVLPEATSIVSSDVLPIVESAVTKKVKAEKILMVKSLTDVRWKSIRISPEAIKLGGVNDPNFAVFKKDLPDTSTGVFLYWFDKDAEEELFFSFEAPLQYKEGTDINFEVYWVPKVNGGVGATVCWGLEHVHANEGSDFGVTTIDCIDTALPSEDLIADRHYRTEIVVCSGVGVKVGHIHICRLFRDATGAGGTDDYDNDAGLLGIGIRYQADALGASTKDAK